MISNRSRDFMENKSREHRYNNNNNTYRHLKFMINDYLPFSSNQSTTILISAMTLTIDWFTNYNSSWSIQEHHPPTLSKTAWYLVIFHQPFVRVGVRRVQRIPCDASLMICNCSRRNALAILPKRADMHLIAIRRHVGNIWTWSPDRRFIIV